MHRAILAAASILLGLCAQQLAPSGPASDALPLTQIAVGSEDLTRILREIARRLPSDSDLAALEEELSQQEQAVGASLRESEAALSSGATLGELRGQARQWRAYRSPEARLRRTLSGWGADCEQSAATLARQQKIWQATLHSLPPVEELSSVRARVQQSLAEIRTLEGVTEGRLKTVLDLQARVVKQASSIAVTIERLGAATQSFQKRLFNRDAPPIWTALAEKRDNPRAEFWTRSLRRSHASAWEFVRSHHNLIVTGLLALAVALLATHALKRIGSGGAPGSPAQVRASYLSGRPLSLALLLWAPVPLSEMSTARLITILPMIQVFAVPVARLLPAMIGCGKRMIWFAAVFYALDGLFWVFELEPSGGREFTVALFAVGLAALAWWEHALRRRADPARSWELLLVRCSLATLAAIFLTNVLGFVLLSNLLRAWALLGSFIALIVYTLGRVLVVLAAAAIQSRGIRSLAAIRLYEGDVMKWTRRTVNVGMALCWANIVLDVMAFRTETLQAIAVAMNTRAGNILGAVGLLAIGYLASKAIRFSLREDVLPRLQLPRGVPETISNCGYYLCLLAVFLMSLNAAGMQLDKLTVLTGALGVGVGFGLQSFVNNFVSGLVLQFERPIRIGDVLEVGALGGEVSRIGIRSSTVRTFQGAEVIIPNSALVSNQVVNWTLSEPLRRVELQVPAAYGTPPERVIEILSGVAAGHPEVRREPPPGAFFQGFGTSSLDFLLMFWAEQGNHFRLRSEIAVGVNAALREAGIEIPLPQQDLHLRSVEFAALSTLARPRSNPPEDPRHHAVAG